MPNPICFRCKQGYQTIAHTPDERAADFAGDGKCAPCKEISKKIAFETDIKMAQQRRDNPVAKSRLLEVTGQSIEELAQGKPLQIKATDLGITFGS